MNESRLQIGNLMVVAHRLSNAISDLAAWAHMRACKRGVAGQQNQFSYHTKLQSVLVQPNSREKVGSTDTNRALQG